jgi:Tol biopolymer transport system component
LVVASSAGTWPQAPGTAAPDGTPLSPEEIVDRIVPADPQISPDGSRVAFVAEPVGRKGEKKIRALWLADGQSPARQLTSGAANDGDPRWSPDAMRILFLFDRVPGEDESLRLFLLPIADGEAQASGNLSGELSQPSWSPDGCLIAVLRRDLKPEAAKARKKERDDAIVVEENSRSTRLWVLDPETGRTRCLTTGEREIRCYAWTPDSSALVVVTTDESIVDAEFGPADAWRVAVGGALPQHVGRFGSWPSSPVVVDSGESLVLAVRADGRREQPSDAVWTVPVAGGEPRNILPDLVGIVEEVAPLPGRPGAVAARIVERTHGRLYVVDVFPGR